MSPSVSGPPMQVFLEDLLGDNALPSACGAQSMMGNRENVIKEIQVREALVLKLEDKGASRGVCGQR